MATLELDGEALDAFLASGLRELRGLCIDTICDSGPKTDRPHHVQNVIDASRTIDAIDEVLRYLGHKP